MTNTQAAKILNIYMEIEKSVEDYNPEESCGYDPDYGFISYKDLDEAISTLTNMVIDNTIRETIDKIKQED